ncbi:MAG TPA: right-handed parallel beta-helix repeat-containing protein [Candidatus Xenobia bacterium]|nr:right-handed parallel beta-helix repeat-containing protein [Candidatus Xenobia bacterium]
MRRLSQLLLVLALALAAPALASAQCTFTTVGTTMYLDADCTTSSTILVPDGYTLDGNGFTITAVDPSGDHFKGAVIKNAGWTAHVTNLTITTSNLANACDAGGDRLRGILFESASGTITHTTVFNLNQGASGCQEGNAIEVRNAPFDGTHPNTQTVEILHNKLSSWQKTGIVANGDVSVRIAFNAVGASATQENLAANSIQLGFGALGTVEHNDIAGNSWLGWSPTSDFAATAVLVFDGGPGIVIQRNNIMEGNADVGIYFQANNGTVDNNRVFETGPDAGYDIGIGDYGTGNSVTNNKVRAYVMPYDGVVGGRNKTIPSPKD